MIRGFVLFFFLLIVSPVFAITEEEFFLEYRKDLAEQLYENIQIQEYRRLVLMIYEQLTLEYPSNPNFYWKQSRALWIISGMSENSSFKEKLYDDSITAIDEGYQLAPDNVNVRLWRAITYGSILNTFNALRYSSQIKEDIFFVLAQEPENIDALIALAVFYYDAPPQLGRDRKKAFEISQKIIRKMSNILQTYLIRADYFLENEDRKKAISILKKALTISDPYKMGNVESIKKKIEEKLSQIIKKKQ